MKIDLLGPDLLEFNEHGVPDGNVLEEVFELVGEILIELNGHDEFLERHQEILNPIHRQLGCRQIFLSYLTRFRVCREGIV
jgi:hypothetical protein